MARVRLFASAREAAGISIFSATGARVIDVINDAVSQFPNLADIVAHCSIMVNDERVLDRTQDVADTDEIAVLPPVSGGT